MNFEKYINKLEIDWKSRESVEAHEKEDERLSKIFKEDAFKELGIQHNVKKEQLYEVAYKIAETNDLRDIL